MGENPSYFSRNGEGKDLVKDISDADLKRFPVEKVSWDQCQLFIAKLNKQVSEPAWVYRLPKDVEWEYACRGGPMSDQRNSAFDFYLGKPTNTLLPEQANIDYATGMKDYGNGLKRTCKVGSYEPNVLGLYDMHGNVWEWCDDTEVSDGVSRHVNRGGSFFDDAWYSRAAHRPKDLPSIRDFHLGLRLARVPSGAGSTEAKALPTDPELRAAE
ncbi:MAG: hypothetical protein JWM11_236 [Planctomycetaceae bacterium]|nr:hypothetical protein [Planctomycetaceae bacterium]